MAVSMMDIARRCGLSRPTVNLVLNGKSHLLRPETVERVLAAATALGYRANAAARAMRLGRHSTIALLSSAAPGMSGVPVTTLNALHDHLAAHGFKLLYSRLPDAQLTDPTQLPAVISDYCADAVIISRLLPAGDPVAAALADANTPAVWFNIERDQDTVRPDDVAAGRDATARLLAAGHRRIAYLNALFTLHTSELDRRRGYHEAMVAAGLTAEAHHAANARTTAGGPALLDMDRFLRSWLGGPQRPTALVLNEPYHVPAVRLACADLGLRIPEDLSLIAICGTASTELGTPTSSLMVPEAELGTALGRMVLARLADPKTRLPTVRVPFSVKAGATVAAPPPVDTPAKSRPRSAKR